MSSKLALFSRMGRGGAAGRAAGVAHGRTEGRRDSGRSALIRPSVRPSETESRRGEIAWQKAFARSGQRSRSLARSLSRPSVVISVGFNCQNASQKRWLSGVNLTVDSFGDTILSSHVIFSTRETPPPARPLLQCVRIELYVIRSQRHNMPSKCELQNEVKFCTAC